MSKIILIKQAASGIGRKYITLTIGLLMFFNGIAQEPKWNIETLNGGKVTVKSQIVT